MGSFAEFEREIMLERQREGVARAKAEGKYKGRVPTARRKTAEVIQLRGRRVTPEEIAKKLGISRASVFRVLKDRRDASNRLRLSATLNPRPPGTPFKAMGPQLTSLKVLTLKRPDNLARGWIEERP
jgi:hypothetical protein